jgi:hypothetical protein
MRLPRHRQQACRLQGYRKRTASNDLTADGSALVAMRCGLRCGSGKGHSYAGGGMILSLGHLMATVEAT